MSLRLNPEVRGHVERGKQQPLRGVPGHLLAGDDRALLRRVAADLSAARFKTSSPCSSTASPASAFVPSPRRREAREGGARGAVRLRPQRRPQPDGGRASGQLAEGRVHVRSAGCDPADRSTRPRSRRWPRSASTCEGVPEAADRRGRQGRRRRDHDGLRRRLPDLSRQALRGLGARRPGGPDLETVRRIRDEIASRVSMLLAELAPDESSD